MSPSGEITDQGVARLRARIGIPEPHPLPPYYTLPTIDTFRNVAVAYGDDNPLWCDPDYGPTTVWGGPIASPNMNGGDTLIGENEITRLDDATRALLKGDPLKGAHAYYSGSRREWWRPLRPGIRIGRRNALVGVHDKRSAFADRSVHEWTAEVFATADEVLSAQYRLMIRTDRRHVEEKADAGKIREVELRPYTDEEI
jgi:acyl dehydratase